MAIIHVEISDEVMDKLKRSFALLTNKEVTEKAFTILNWVADEKASGRVVLSAAPSGDDVKRLRHSPLY